MVSLLDGVLFVIFLIHFCTAIGNHVCLKETITTTDIFATHLVDGILIYLYIVAYLLDTKSEFGS